MAGLWDMLPSPENSSVPGFAIITTNANEPVSPIHGCMPVILPETEERALVAQTTDITALRTLLKPPRSDPLVAFEVLSKVNSAKHNGQNSFWQCRGPLLVLSGGVAYRELLLLLIFEIYEGEYETCCCRSSGVCSGNSGVIGWRCVGLCSGNRWGDQCVRKEGWEHQDTLAWHHVFHLQQR